MKKYQRRKTLPKLCEFCRETYSKTPKETHDQWEVRKFCSKSCALKAMVGKRGKETNHWLGEKVGYHGIHQWLEREYGKPDYCEGVVGIVCEQKGRYEWAVLHNKGYARDRSHFKRLCCSCHRKYDFKKSWNKGTTKIQNVNCQLCEKSFWPGYKIRQFCSNTCSARFRASAKEHEAEIKAALG